MLNTCSLLLPGRYKDSMDYFFEGFVDVGLVPSFGGLEGLPLEGTWTFGAPPSCRVGDPFLNGFRLVGIRIPPLVWVS